MAISFVGAKTGTSTNGQDITIDLSTISGITAGDFVVVATGVYYRGGGEGTINYGSYSNYLSSYINTHFLCVYYGFYGDSSFTVNGSGNTLDAMATVAMVFRGVNNNTVYDSPSTASGSSTNPDPSSVNPSVDNCCILAIASSKVSDSTVGTITNYTIPANGAANISDNNPSTTAIAYRILGSGTAGFDQNPSAFNSWTTGTWAAITVALKPLVIVDCIANNLTVGSPDKASGVLTYKLVVTATNFVVSSPVLGVPLAASGTAVVATSLAVSSPVIASGVFLQDYVFSTPGLFVAVPIVGGEGVLHQLHNLQSIFIDSGSPVLGEPALVFVNGLLATAHAVSSPVIDAATLTQNHSLTPIGIALNKPVFDVGDFRQNHIFSAVNIADSSPVTGIPEFHQGFGLNAHELVVGSPVFSGPVIGQLNNFVAVNKTIISSRVGVGEFNQICILHAVNIGVTGSIVVGDGVSTSKRIIIADDFIVSGAVEFSEPSLRELFNPRVKFYRADAVWTYEELVDWAEGYDSDGEYVRPLDHVGEKRKEAIFTNYNDKMYIETPSCTLIGNDEDEHGTAKCIEVVAPFYFDNRKLKIDLTDKASVADFVNEVADRLVVEAGLTSQLANEVADRLEAEAGLTSQLALFLAEYNALKSDYVNLSRALSVGKGAISLSVGSPVMSSTTFGQKHYLGALALVVDVPSFEFP